MELLFIIRPHGAVEFLSCFVAEMLLFMELLFALELLFELLFMELLFIIIRPHGAVEFLKMRCGFVAAPRAERWRA